MHILLNKEPTIHLVEFADSTDRELEIALVDDGFHLISYQFKQASTVFPAEQQPNLILLNFRGEQSGVLACCRNLRSAYPKCAICLIHEGLSEWEESVALELGADVVISHQAELRRILAQVRALLRRQKRAEEPCFQLESGTRMVKVGGQTISLTDAEFELLSVLARAPGTVVSRDTISQHLQGLTYNGRNRIIDLRIARIRQKLGDDAKDPQFIRTVRGEGYMLMKDTT